MVGPLPEKPVGDAWIQSVVADAERAAYRLAGLESSDDGAFLGIVEDHAIDHADQLDVAAVDAGGDIAAGPDGVAYTLRHGVVPQKRWAIRGPHREPARFGLLQVRHIHWRAWCGLSWRPRSC